MAEQELLKYAAGVVYGLCPEGGVLYVTWTETPSAQVWPRTADGEMSAAVLDAGVSPELAGEIKWFVKAITNRLRPEDAAAVLTASQDGSHCLVVMVDADRLLASASLINVADRSKRVTIGALQFRLPGLVH